MQQIAILLLILKMCISLRNAFYNYFYFQGKKSDLLISSKRRLHKTGHCPFRTRRQTTNTRFQARHLTDRLQKSHLQKQRQGNFLLLTFFCIPQSEERKVFLFSIFFLSKKLNFVFNSIFS